MHIHGNLFVQVWLGVILGVELIQCVIAGAQDDQSVRIVQIGETIYEFEERSASNIPAILEDAFHAPILYINIRNFSTICSYNYDAFT